jgi:hypothetical protein
MHRLKTYWMHDLMPPLSRNRCLSARSFSRCDLHPATSAFSQFLLKKQTARFPPSFCRSAAFYISSKADGRLNLCFRKKRIAQICFCVNGRLGPTLAPKFHGTRFGDAGSNREIPIIILLSRNGLGEHPLSALTSESQRSDLRARDRHLPRDRAAVVEPFWSDVCCGHGWATDKPRAEQITVRPACLQKASCVKQNPARVDLNSWYHGITMVDALGFEPRTR